MAGSSSAAIFCVKEEESRSTMLNSSAPVAPSKKKKRNQPGTPDPDAEVVALSPETLMATNRFICEVCNKGFQREQNLQLHRRGHNLPWKLKQKASRDVRKKVYLCPEPGCVHHDPSRALGDLTGIKKHFSRKHGEKRFKCDKCNKKYAVHSDWKAHSKICGTKEYKCDCGTVFSRRDSFLSHRAYCEALAQETARHSVSSIAATIYANASSTAMTLGSTAPLMSADHQEPAVSPVFELGAPAATSKPSFTDLHFGHSVGSSFRPIHEQPTVPAQPPEPKLNFHFSEFQGFHQNTAPTSPMFSLDGPQNYEDDLKMNSIGLFTGLMMSGDAPVYNTTPQLSATALLQKAALIGSNTSSADLMKSLGSSSSGGRTFSNYGGVFGDGICGIGAGGGTYHEVYSTTSRGVTAGSFGNGGDGVGVGLSDQMNHNTFGGVTYNVKNNNGMKVNIQEHDNIGLEPGMNVQNGYCDKLTRDFLGVGKMRSFSGGMEDDQRGYGTELNSPDSEATTSAEPKLPFDRNGRSI